MKIATFAPWLHPQAVLAYPQGVVRLMDMMAQREVVRNESLLLMIVLTHSNADVQKIAAFEGAFERLFNIIRHAQRRGESGLLLRECICQMLWGIEATR